MKDIYEGYVKYAEKKLKEGPNARAMVYREVGRLGLAAFKPGAKVVWTTTYCIPSLLYWPFGVVPFDFEFAAIQLTATGRAPRLLEQCNRLGYAVDTCSAHRVALGAEDLGLYPHADLLISTTHFCDGKPKSNEVFKEKYGVPYHLIDIPLERDTAALDYLEEQLRKVFLALCQLSNTPQDERILVPYIRNYNRVLTLMEEVNNLRKQKPAPFLPGNRGFTMSMNSTILYGREELTGIYEQYVKELEAAPREGGPDGGERFRLLWLLANPAYPNNIFETLKEFGARVVAEEFTFEFMHPLDEQKPLRSIAEWILDSRFIRPVEERIEAILKWVEEYKIDGVISFTHLPCRQGNGALYLIKKKLMEKGVVLMDLEADLCDPSTLSPERFRSIILDYVSMMR